MSDASSQGERPRLLFVYLTPASFVRDDHALLAEDYDIRTFHFDADEARTPLGLLRLAARQLRWLLRELPEADLVYGWFADYHMALPVLAARLAGVPVAVVLGGMDCNWLPELGYGVWESRWRAPLVRRIVRAADLLPTVSASLLASVERYSQWPAARRHGIEERVPALTTPRPVIPLGFRPGDWPMGPAERAPVVTTVAFIDSRRTFRIKGIDVFLETARHVPEATFQVVGVDPGFAETVRRTDEVPDNVALRPPRPRDELPAVYQKTSVYAQLSRVEAFGMVVGEAMLSGCVPVVSAVGNLPALVGEAGHVVERPEPARVADVIRTALQADESARTAARSRITEHFTLAQRKTRLRSALDDLRG